MSALTKCLSWVRQTTDNTQTNTVYHWFLFLLNLSCRDLRDLQDYLRERRPDYLDKVVYANIKQDDYGVLQFTLKLC